MRTCGTLLHISSLPSKYGIGTLGVEAERFVDFLKDSGQGVWQVLPIGPTSVGDSPYQSFSAYAGNPLFIDLDKLIDEGLLTSELVEKTDFGEDSERVDYEKQFLNKYPLLWKAFEKFERQDNRDEFKKFCEDEKDWLDDYALFMSLKYCFKQLPWNLWENDIRTRQPAAMAFYKNKMMREREYWCFLQFIFYSQWFELREYANQRNIKIIGDIPFYVSYDSADVWAHPEMFELDKNLLPVRVAGCPPDDTFSKTGQLWGNPLYRWDYMEKTDFDWWLKRIRHSLKLYNVLRIDHFRGFDSYYAVPFENKTAEHGEWVQGPGEKLISAIKKSLGNAEIIAEDLGFQTESVKQLLKSSGYPGMNVMEYAFSGEKESENMPHNFSKNSVTYLGTHDNDTCLGYLKKLNADTYRFLQKYVDSTDLHSSIWHMIQSAYASVSETVIIQMQDFLELDSAARMNFPSTATGNWTWRMKKKSIDQSLVSKIESLSLTYFRNPVKQN